MDQRRRAAALLVVLALVGCTPSAGETPSPSPTPVHVTPSESSLERQERLDFEAAEKSYRAFRKEYRRILHDGGAGGPTKIMRQTAAGPYLAEFVPIIEGYEKKGWTERGPETIVYVRRTEYYGTHVTLETCEDGRKHASYDRSGKLLGKGEIRTAKIDVRKIDGSWKLWSGDGEKVKSCE